MRYFVAFDGMGLSEEAVRRTESMLHADDDLVVGTAIPDGDTDFARERGWLDSDEPFELDSVADRAREDVTSLAPTATFKPVRVGRHASSGAVGSRLRRLVRDIEPEIVVVGSENAGHRTGGIGSIGSSIIGGDSYDVLVVRRARE